ncbi:hypothetical protein GQS52_06685 [Streptomyces sp. SCUT-3]|uniref:hypothetical protein n=1 Tax=unclassified Streptomyces TaxID=2593676 RepID=UPI0015FBC6E0|nr:MULTISPECIES: hypothetical protein [unclassified Streptomyces]MCZ2528035.1 hypothetical protein [Streptomyces sp. HB2AG]QMV21511.1 hypothetical protein GQS52_06685 [Streptomyces sp. SCUT-3]
MEMFSTLNSADEFLGDSGDCSSDKAFEADLGNVSTEDALENHYEVLVPGGVSGGSAGGVVTEDAGSSLRES